MRVRPPSKLESGAGNAAQDPDDPRGVDLELVIRTRSKAEPRTSRTYSDGTAARHPPLNIFLNGHLVADCDGSIGAIDFNDATWLAWENAISALVVALREDRSIGAPVIAVFDNLLPDNDASDDAWPNRGRRGQMPMTSDRSWHDRVGARNSCPMAWSGA